jgi:hypothetical protein
LGGGNGGGGGGGGAAVEAEERLSQLRARAQQLNTQLQVPGINEGPNVRLHWCCCWLTL